jgi:hypothetical protein
MPVCLLCGEDKPLIDAHIIPKGFHPEPAAIGPAVLVSNKAGVYPRRAPVGVYDQHILCAECDGALGILDQHAIENLLNSNAANILEGNAKRYADADAATVLRFIASVAWRASASKHDMFDRVELGPYGGALKEVATGDSDAAPVSAFLAEFDVPSPPYLNPHRTKIEGVNFLVIYAARFIFYLKLDKRPTPRAFDALQIRPGRPVVALVRSWHSSKEKQIMRTMSFHNDKMVKLLDRWGWKGDD